MAMAPTNSAMATMVFAQVGNLVNLRNIPSATANTMNKIEVVATAPSATTFAPLASKPLKVVATTSAKAAITRMEKSHVKSKNRRFPSLPMYFSIMTPMDLPLFRTEAYIAEKSCTAPKNTPPIKIHNNTGTHPKMAA